MRTSVLIALMTALASPALATAATPEGWFLAGSDPASYEVERETGTAHDGKASMRLASTRDSKGFGTAMQCIDAEEYLGKRIRYSGFVRANDVRHWAGLWMRVDGPAGEGQNSMPKVLAFDNMQNRAIKATQDWKRFEVVLDVAREAKGLCFGILLDGPGTVWLRDVGFEVVPNTVATTGMGMQKQQSKKPVNLDFGH